MIISLQFDITKRVVSTCGQDVDLSDTDYSWDIDESLLLVPVDLPIPPESTTTSRIAVDKHC